MKAKAAIPTVNTVRKQLPSTSGRHADNTALERRSHNGDDTPLEHRSIIRLETELGLARLQLMRIGETIHPAHTKTAADMRLALENIRYILGLGKA